MRVKCIQGPPRLDVGQLGLGLGQTDFRALRLTTSALISQVPEGRVNRWPRWGRLPGLFSQGCTFACPNLTPVFSVSSEGQGAPSSLFLTTLLDISPIYNPQKCGNSKFGLTYEGHRPKCPQRLGGQTAPSATSCCVTWGKPFTFLGFSFPHLENGPKTGTHGEWGEQNLALNQFQAKTFALDTVVIYFHREMCSPSMFCSCCDMLLRFVF